MLCSVSRHCSESNSYYMVLLKPVVEVLALELSPCYGCLECHEIIQKSCSLLSLICLLANVIKTGTYRISQGCNQSCSLEPLRTGCNIIIKINPCPPKLSPGEKYRLPLHLNNIKTLEQNSYKVVYFKCFCCFGVKIFSSVYSIYQIIYFKSFSNRTMEKITCLTFGNQR